MIQDSFDLVHHLLADKKLTLAQKERVFQLSSNFMKTDSELIKTLDKQLKNINEKVEGLEKRSGLGDVLGGAKKVEKKNDFKKIHSPKTMVKFLYNFSIDEKFKWFTHNPEGLLTEFEYHDYIACAKKELNKTTGWNINNGTYHNVKNFIIKSSEDKKTTIYGKGNIKYDWSDLEDWCNENPKKHPYNADLSNGKFKKFINQFKQIIEFRTDNADEVFNIRVRKLIRNLLGVDFNPIFSNSFNEIGQSVNIFCDVNLLFNALEQIIGWIANKKANSNVVEIDLVDNIEYYQLEITHKNSCFSTSIDNVKLKGISGDFDKVRKILFSVADWEIETTIKDNGIEKDIKLICLDSETELINNVLTENKVEILNTSSKKVKHIIKLYKTRNL